MPPEVRESWQLHEAAIRRAKAATHKYEAAIRKAETKGSRAQTAKPHG